jgi:hypothetical protein
VEGTGFEPSVPRDGRQRPVVANAQWTAGAANPRFIVISLSSEDAAPQSLYGEIEFRIAREAEDFAEASPRETAVCRTAEDVVLE